MGGAGGSFGVHCIFNVECTIAMMSLSGTWLGGAVVIYIYIYIYHTYICICMIGQIFKALLELMFSFFGNNTMLW